MRQRKHFKFRPRDLDTEQFEELYTILRVTICHGNMASTAKLLGVTRPTAFRWMTHPPKPYWWNKTLIAIMDEIIEEMFAGSNKHHRQIATAAQNQLSQYRRIPAGTLSYDHANDSQARRHILSLFKQHQKITSRMLRLPAYSGGYSFRTLTRAIETLGLDRSTKGFGKDKKTTYRLPTIKLEDT